MSPRYRFGLVLGAAATLLAYKLLTIAPLGWGPIALGWVLESALLVTWYALFELTRPIEQRWLKRAFGVLFYAGFYPLVVVSIAHTFFFESAAERRISLLSIDLATLRFFFTDVLPLRGLLLMIGLLVLIHGIAFAVARITKTLTPRVRIFLFAAMWLFLGTALMLRPHPPSPFADIGADLWEQLTTPEIVIDRKQPARYRPTMLDKSGAPAAVETPFDKVLVFVMETMTSNMLDEQRKLLPASTFVNRIPKDAHVYGHYFATNQDSRTGMLSMLGSRFIPYEAYTEDGRDHYMKLGDKSSLVDLFKAQHYRTAFAVSQEEIELVVGDLKWDEIINFAEGDAAKLKGEHLCFVPYEFEHSCEDRALLDRVLSFIDGNERVFLYQEFVWGHASEYNKASGKTNTEYYSTYLDSVVKHLEQTGQLARTLIVLTSDHGFRDKSIQVDPAVYHIPLWFYAPGMTGSHDSRLFSHLDFKSLLIHELSERMPSPGESPFVMIIGPTGTSFLTVMTQPGQFLLMKARASERYLVHQDGFSDAAQSGRAAGDFLRLFDDYLTYFGKL